MKIKITYDKALEIANEFLETVNPSSWDGKGDMPDDVNTWLCEYEFGLNNNDYCLNLSINGGWFENDYRVYIDLVETKGYNAVNVISTDIINSPEEIAKLIIKLLDESEVN